MNDVTPEEDEDDEPTVLIEIDVELEMMFVEEDYEALGEKI